MADIRYRYKKYTSRTSAVSAKDIEKIRSSALKKANTFKKQKFIQSKAFDRLIRQNVKQNRIKQNYKYINDISETYAQDPTQRQRIKDFFGESNKYRNGKKYTVNSLSSKKQTERLKKIVKAKKNGKDINLNRYVKRTKRFKEAVANEVVESTATFEEALEVLFRSDFYIQEKDLVLKHNKNVDKYGYYEARNKKVGINLRNKYTGKSNSESEALINELFKLSGE